MKVTLRPTAVQLLFFFLLLFPPKVQVDGRRIFTWWFRPLTVPVGAGSHTVEVSRWYGKASATVVVAATETARLRYSDGLVRYSIGRLRVIDGLEIASEAYGLRVGDHVRHGEFGVGVIRRFEVAAGGASTIAVTSFPESGLHRVDLDVEVLDTIE